MTMDFELELIRAQTAAALAAARRPFWPVALAALTAGGLVGALASFAS